jgi:hypothetical protein
VALVAAGALCSSAALTRGMGRLLEHDLQQLGADLVLAPKGYGDAARELLRTGAAAPVPAAVPVGEWKQKLKAAKVVGVDKVEGWVLAEGGKGSPATGPQASFVLVHLLKWASPMIALQEVSAAIPEAEVVVAEEATRQVTRNLAPVVKYMGLGAAVALLGAVLMTGLLASIRVGERRGELGMMRAMGASRSFLVRLTLAETGVTAAGGGLLGVALALVLLLAVPESITHRITGMELAGYAAGAAALTCLVAEAAALGPALRAGRMDPLDAARRGR